MKKLIRTRRPAFIRGLFAVSIILIQLFGSYQNGFCQSLFKSSEMSLVGMLGANEDGGWVMSSYEIEGQGFVVIDKGNRFTSLAGFSFSVNVKTLKSMKDVNDRRFYDLIRSEEYPEILFNADSVRVQNPYGDKYLIIASGRLFIAGVQKQVFVELDGRLNANKKLNLYGSVNIKLSEFNINCKAARKIVNNDLTLTLNLLLENEPVLAFNKK